MFRFLTCNRWLIVLLLALPGLAFSATFYVATTGDDTTGDGSIGNPWKTITKGQSMLSPGDTLQIRGGRYYEMVTLTVQGADGSPITIQNYPGEEVILDGTAAVTGWVQCASDEPFLTVQGVTNPNYASIYKAKVPASLLPTIRQDTTQHKIEDFKMFQLFEEGIHCRIARWPDQELGYGYDTSLFNSVAPEAYGETNFLLDTARLDQADDYWIGSFIDLWSHAANNVVVRRLISDSSQSEKTVTFHTPLDQPISSGSLPDAYSIANHPHVLDSAGEFAHTTEVENIDGVDYYWFYYWPLDADNLTDKISIPSKTNGVYAYNKSYVTIDGLKVFGYAGEGIYWRLNEGNQNGIHVLNCIVEDCGASGIYLIRASYSSIEDCFINRVGGRGAFITNGTRGLIKGCDISDTQSTNMSFYTMTYSSMIGNTLRGSSGVHGNGSSCYINCDKILIAYNDYRKSNLALNDIHNIIVFGNTLNGREEMTSIVTTWPGGYAGTGELQLYLHNTILGSTNSNALALYSRSTEPYPQTYAINNVLDGMGTRADYGDGYTQINGIEEVGYNLYTGYLWTQSPATGWALQTGEIDGRTVPLTSLFADPDPSSETESYAPKAGSPIIAAGKNVTALLSALGVAEWFPEFDFTKDFAGNTWAATPSIGAFEYDAESTPITFTLAVNSSGASGVAINSATGHSGTTGFTKTITNGTTVTLTAPAIYGSLDFAGWTGPVTSSDRTITFTMDGDKTITAIFEPELPVTLPELIRRWEEMDGYFEESAIADLALNRPMTFSARIKIDAKTGYSKVLIKPHTAYAAPWEMYAIDLGNSGDTPRFVVTDGTAGGAIAIASNTAIHLDTAEWHHLAGTYDGSSIKLYLNGVLIATQAVGFTPGVNASPLCIGGRQGNNMFNGTISDVRLYNTALSALQVDQLYHNPYILTVSAVNGTITRSPNKANYIFGEQVTLTAAAAAGYTFTGWTGDATGTANPVTLTMDGNKTVTAAFAPIAVPTYSLTISAANGNVTKRVNGVVMTATSFAHGTTVQLTATANTGYTFSGWSGSASGTANPVSITMDGNKAVTANFTQNTYTLGITAANGSVTKRVNGVVTTATSFAHGTVVSLTAAPNTGYAFANWSGSATGTTNPVSITMDGNKTVTANFTQNTYTLGITAANGSVTKRVNGVVTTATSFAHGTVVSLTAAPNTGYTFANWSGSVTGTANPVSITMDGNKAVTANFTQNTYTLGIAATNGSVTKRVNGVVTTATSFAHGTVVSLTAAPNTGYTFANWSGSVTSTNNPISITMDGNKAVTANFTQNTYTLGITAANGSVTKRVNGVVTTATSFAHGTVVSLTAAPNTGYTFANWSGSASGTANPISITMDGNKAVTANFTQNTYTLGITAANGSVTKRVNGVVTTATSFAHGTVVSLTAAPNTGYTFANWSGSASGTANPVSITMDGNKAVTVNFTQNTYTLGITANNGSVTKRVNGVVTTATSFAHGTVVSLTAAPNTGYTFANWSGNATGTANPISITMDGNKAVTANFTQNTYTLGITATNGSVTKRVNGVITTATSFAHGTVVSLTTAPNTGYAFANWSGSASGTANPVSITMDGNKAVTANFTQNTYTLAITATNGSVTKRVNGVITTATSFAHGTIVSLTAAANTGYTFANWSGSATGTANPVSITMDANKAVTANFAQVSLDLNPVAQWLFNEPYQATAIDLVSGQPASLINDPEWGEGWAQEHFVRLGSAQQAVQIPMSGCSTQAGTVALWVMPQASNDTQYLFGHTFNGANRIALYTVFTANGNALTLGMGNAIALHQNIAILSPDVLYHIVLTWNNGSYAVYVDGIEAAAGSYSGLNALNTYADVGNYGNAATRTLGFRGLVEEVQLHSRALAPSEVQALFLTHNVKENRPIQFVVNGTDGLGNPISYTASNLPQGASFDFATQTFSWRPALYNTAGRYEIFLSAPGQPTETVTIAVQDVQRAGWYEAFLAHLGLN